MVLTTSTIITPALTLYSKIFWTNRSVAFRRIHLRDATALTNAFTRVNYSYPHADTDTKMTLPNHSEIIGVLTELYTLLDTLAAISPDLTPRFPPPNTGVHPPTVFNADAARAAGFDAEAITVLSALPYLNVGDHEMHTALQPNTYPVSYLGALNEGDFLSRREMLEEDDLMPPSAIQLTWEEGGNGIIHIYDTQTGTVQHRQVYVSVWVC